MCEVIFSVFLPSFNLINVPSPLAIPSIHDHRFLLGKLVPPCRAKFLEAHQTLTICVR
jgi:hypothetical protein